MEVIPNTSAWGDAAPTARTPVDDLAGQQRFLGLVAGHVESTTVPLHVRPVRQNLAVRRFEKLSFLTGTPRLVRDRVSAGGPARTKATSAP